MTRTSQRPSLLLWSALLAWGFLQPAVINAQNAAQRIVDEAANALGGRERVLGARTLLLEGGGHDFEIEQGLRWDDLGMQSDVSQIRGYKRAHDLTNGRARFEMTRQRQYAFYQGEAPMPRVVQCLDGTLAFNVAEDGRATRVFAPAQIDARRFEYLRHPLTLVRAALDPAAKLANVRTEGKERLVDVTIGDITLTAAFDSSTKLPTRVIRMTDSATLGDRAVETRFGDYQRVNGLQLPTRFTSRTDRFVSADVRILRQAVDGDVGSLAAPANVAAATPPANTGPAQSLPAPAQEIGKGIWFVTGTTHHSLLVEFSDHMLLVEAPNIERTQAVMAKAKELRPNKPVTTLLVTHHHGDHTGGVRTAVGMGITEIITHKSNVEFLTEMFRRPHTINPDLFSKTPGAKAPKITAIDDQGVVKDGSLTMNLYHLLDNTHADSQLVIYFPRERIFTQADDYFPNDARNVVPGEPLGHAPWNVNVLANVNHRKLQVEHMAPIHGEYVPYNQFLESTILLTQFLPKQEQSSK
jgi:glyoxylase-like metal-dependent hydrolase (beta-lactamase superfamily II)